MSPIHILTMQPNPKATVPSDQGHPPPLLDFIKRLGRIEKHLIDIRDSLARDPGQPRYVIDRHRLS